MQQTPQLSQVSEDSLIIQWPISNDLPTPADALYIGSFAKGLIQKFGKLVLNVTPAYQSILLQFDVLQIDYHSLSDLILTTMDSVGRPSADSKSTSTHKIPVFYDARVAADLLPMCESKDLAVEQLIQQHTAAVYSVYAVGFQPGFAYLGHVSKILATPRHSSFRAEVAAGSVAIADRQTAVYPVASPGGWNIIGRTPIDMIDGVTSRMLTGDTVQFYAIDVAEFMRLGGELA